MTRRDTISGAALAVVALVFAGWTLGVPSQQGERYEVAGDQVAIYNLAGTVRVEAGSGPAVTVAVERGGPDAGELRVETGRIDGVETLRVIYPADVVVYSRGRGRWDTTLRVRDDGTFGDQEGWRDRGRRVRVRSYGSGFEGHADLTIRVPRGQRFSLYHAAGEISATNVDGEILLDSHSAPVTVRGARGSLVVDVGSGSVEVSDVVGSANLDTGSGSVRVTNVTGDELIVDTGSGSVDVTGVAVRSLSIDTGSGGVDVADAAAERVLIDTGSGGVNLTLTENPEDVTIDTGSGSVTVRVPDSYGARVEIETGSGGIDLDFPVQVRHIERSEVRGTIGDGSGQLVIDTGSGSVRLLRHGG